MMYGLTAKHFQARAELKRLRKLSRTLKKKTLRNAPPQIAEAFAILIDDQLEWSADFNRIRHPLALLLLIASDLPIAAIVAEELLYAKDDVE